jgi:hypothetical protein
VVLVLDAFPGTPESLHKGEGLLAFDSPPALAAGDGSLMTRKGYGEQTELNPGFWNQFGAVEVKGRRQKAKETLLHPEKAHGMDCISFLTGCH